MREGMLRETGGTSWQERGARDARVRKWRSRTHALASHTQSPHNAHYVTLYFRPEHHPSTAPRQPHPRKEKNMDNAPPTPAQARPAPSHGRATQRRREEPHPRTSKARSGALSGNRQGRAPPRFWTPVRSRLWLRMPALLFERGVIMHPWEGETCRHEPNRIYCVLET